MKIAVTGANGFVGRHVLAALADAGVAALPVLRPGTRLPAQFAALQTVQLDIADPDVDALAQVAKADALIHLAWGGLPNYRSLHHFEHELPVHYRFVKALVESGLQSVLVTGTCFEYGMQSGELHEALPCVPDNPYGYAKDALRRQLQFLQRTTAFGLTWARLFYMYGEGQAAGSLYMQLKRAAESGETSFPMSAGEQLRDYLPIETVARHLAALAMAKADAGIVNVCSGQPVSVRALVERLIGDNGWRIAPALGRYPYPDYEPLAFWGSAQKLRLCLQRT